MFIFQSARVRLTGWYVLIVTLITLSFSGLIYKNVSDELERGFTAAEYRLRGQILPTPALRTLLSEELAEAKRIFLLRLAMIDLIVITGAGVAGYFLAGKTLGPIEEMMKDQRRFVGDASHELRTPLTTLRSEIEVALLDKELSISEAKQMLESNLEEVNKMQNLTNYLLTLNRYDKNQNNIEKKKVDLVKIAKKITEKNIRITTSFKQTIVMANQTSIEELITILIDNSQKYTPEDGEVKITIKPVRGGGKIEVSDTGIGIPANDIPHIFDRFYRSDLSRNTDGYGLGLSIAKSIVDMHEGEIRVKSKVNLGTVFTVILPRRT